MNVGRRRSKSMTEKISGGAFKQMVAFGAACITREKQAINDLNVFPCLLYTSDAADDQ